VVASFRDDRLHWVNLPSNSGGPSLPRDEGLRRAKGQFIAYLGHDDLWFPWHLSELVDCIEVGRSDFVYSLGAIMAPDGMIGSFSLAQRAWSRTEFISPCNWLHRKRLIETVGSWSTDKRYGDDQEFLRRVLNSNLTLGFRRKLSVLKFPAEMWHMYSLTTDLPQTRYAEAMRQDPARLHNELLLEFATFMSRGPRQRRLLYRRLVDHIVLFLLHSYGLHRWPVNRLLYRRWRRKSGLS
jgi:glycosyltransferase involved in cell wall biosynthesis